MNGRTAFDAMRRGDASAKAVVDGYVHYLCVGITSIVNIFQPEVLCVGGGISREGEAVMAPVRAYVGKYGYARGSAKQPRIVAASLAGDAGIIGAALLGTEKKKLPIPLCVPEVRVVTAHVDLFIRGHKIRLHPFGWSLCLCVESFIWTSYKECMPQQHI